MPTIDQSVWRLCYELDDNRGRFFFQVKVTLQLTVSQSVCLDIEPQYISSGYKMFVVPMWGALSDERTGLSFVRVIVSSIKSIVSMYNYLHFTCY
jgi:hypothetical protein